jgi:hypothetical protein
VANGSVLLRVRGSNRAKSEGGPRSSGEGVEGLKADAIDRFEASLMMQVS